MHNTFTLENILSGYTRSDPIFKSFSLHISPNKAENNTYLISIDNICFDEFSEKKFNLDKINLNQFSGNFVLDSQYDFDKLKKHLSYYKTYYHYQQCVLSIAGDDRNINALIFTFWLPLKQNDSNFIEVLLYIKDKK